MAIVLTRRLACLVIITGLIASGRYAAAQSARTRNPWASSSDTSQSASTEFERLPAVTSNAAAVNSAGDEPHLEAPAAIHSLPSCDGDYKQLARRLAIAEAELQALKTQSSAWGVQSAGYVVADAASQTTAAAAPSLEARFNALHKEWSEFQAAAKKTKYPNVTVNGVFQADAGWFHQDTVNRMAAGDLQDGADFRRARLSAKGAAWQNVNYMFQLDFGFFGRPTFTDLWVDVTQLPVLGNVRIGQWKQPFSLEVVTSFRYQTFIERSLLFQTFTPFRHLGVGFYDHAENLSATAAASVFRTGQDQFGGDIGDNGGWSLAARGTYLPWYDESSEGRGYLHTGLAYNFGDPDNDRSRFATIPEFFVGEVAPGAVGTSLVPVPGAADGTRFFVDTGNIATSTFNKLGAEVALNLGPLAIQSEAMYARVGQVAGPDLDFAGFYVQTSYFLTGEHRPYDRTVGAFDRVKPFEDFFRVRTCRGIGAGSGAWELAARWSYVDLNDNNIQGGQLNDATLGLNWYLNPYLKIQFNYIRAMLDHPTLGASAADIFALRTQVDF